MPWDGVNASIPHDLLAPGQGPAKEQAIWKLTASVRSAVRRSRAGRARATARSGYAVVGEVAWAPRRSGRGIQLNLSDNGRLDLDVAQRLPVTEIQRPGGRRRPRVARRAALERHRRQDPAKVAPLRRVEWMVCARCGRRPCLSKRPSSRVLGLRDRARDAADHHLGGAACLPVKSRYLEVALFIGAVRGRRWTRRWSPGRCRVALPGRWGGQRWVGTGRPERRAEPSLTPADPDSPSTRWRT
jgi:hypothetical protein